MLRRMRHFALIAAMLALGGPTAALRAQDPAVQPPAQPPAARDSLEARVRQRMAQVVQRQVGLTDDQMRRLQVTNRRFEGQRRELLLKERRVRMGLRDEIELGDSTRQAQVARLLDEMLQLQRERLAVLEAEQKELATFMTPHQRARYFGMEEQLRRRMEEMRQQGGRPPAGGVRRPDLPPGGRPGAGAGVRRPPG